MTQASEGDLIRLTITITSRRDDLWIVPRLGQAQPIEIIRSALYDKLYDVIRDVRAKFSGQKEVYLLDCDSLHCTESDFKLYVEISQANEIEIDYSPTQIQYIEPPPPFSL